MAPPEQADAVVETTEPEIADSENTASEPTLAQTLASILDKYFEQDAELKQSYEVAQAVDSLQELPLISTLQPNHQDLVAGVELCKKLVFDPTKTMVKANISHQRTTLIIRDLPRDVQYEHIKKLLEDDALTSQLTSRVKEIRPELNEHWFVSFASQDDCLKAAEWLTFHGRINGQPVKCRVKSVLQTTQYQSPQTTPQEPMYDQFYNGYYQQPQFYPPYQGYYQTSPNFGSYQNNNNQQQRRRRGNRQGRGRGRGRNNQYNYNNDYRGGRGGGRKQNQQRSQKPTVSDEKQPTTPRKTTAEEADPEGINYEKSFKFFSRSNFEAVVRHAMAANEAEPVCPAEYDDFRDLITEHPKFDFDDAPVNSGIAISPFPSAQQGPQTGSAAPPTLDLNAPALEPESETPENIKLADDSIPEEADAKEEEEPSQIVADAKAVAVEVGIVSEESAI